MENILGILGGMGPMASQKFCELLISRTKADTDRDHINFILLNHATMPDRTASILGGNTAELERLLYEDCKQLQDLGCRAICVACNTSHYLIHKFENRLSIPVISIVRESAKEMGRRFPGGRVAVLATDGTVKTRLFQEALMAQGVEPYLPSAEGQKLVMHLIYDCVKASRPTDRAAAKALDRELKSAGCSAALLACTELPLLRDVGLFGIEFYIDPMEIMADRAIEFMGKEVR
jgi:aspartate racemase